MTDHDAFTRMEMADEIHRLRADLAAALEREQALRAIYEAIDAALTGVQVTTSDITGQPCVDRIVSLRSALAMERSLHLDTAAIKDAALAAARAAVPASVDKDGGGE